MIRLIRLLATFVGSLLLLLGVFYLGTLFYFTHVNRIAGKVEASATQRAHARHIHILSYTEIPEMYRNAVIATEDRRFAWDPGVDPLGTARSIVADVKKDGYVEGGSTITQQLVDNTIIGNQKTITRKITQAFYAIGLYETMRKPKIFTLYANDIYFGHGAYGLNAAAEIYFGRTPTQLNDGELTMLAGLPNAPSVNDPLHDLDAARKRQLIVLQSMVDDGQIDATQSKEIYQLAIRLKNQ
jgi:monofunctional glycosyltransferase